MSNNYTFKTSAFRSTTADVAKLNVKKEGEFNDILDIIPSVKDGNKDIDHNIPPKIEFLGKYVNVVPVTDANGKLTTLQVYIQENRNYQGLSSSMVTDPASAKSYWLFDNGATKPTVAPAWGSKYDKCTGSIIANNATTGWGTISLSVGALGDATHHGNTKGFSLPNLESKIRVTVYTDNDATSVVSETPVIKTSGNFAGSTDTSITNVVTISGTAKVLGDEAASDGRSPNTVEVTGFTVTVKPHGILNETIGGMIRYRIDLVEGSKVTKVFERDANNYLFYAVCAPNTAVTLTSSNKVTKTRVVCGTTYNIEGCSVDILASGGTGFTGGARSSLNLWTLTPNKGSSITRTYSDVSHTQINHKSDELSDSKTVTFTGNDFDGAYSITTKKFNGSGSTSSNHTSFSNVFTNVWANPSTASTDLNENFADSDSVSKRLSSSLATGWTWNATTDAKCVPQGAGNGKGKLTSANTSDAVSHVRNIFNSSISEAKSNFDITFETATTWTDWTKVQVLCAIKSNPNVWYAINQKADTYTSDKTLGIATNNISDSTKTFNCSFPTGINTPGKDGIYIKIVIPKGSSAAVYPYSVTFK